MTGICDRVVEVLAHLNHYDGTAKRGTPAPLTIALSHQTGAGGAEIARIVGTRLNWPIYDHELLDQIAEEMGLNAHHLEHLDERYVSWIEEVAHSFWAPRKGKGDATRICESSPASRLLFQRRDLLFLLRPTERTQGCLQAHRQRRLLLPSRCTIRTAPLHALP